MRIFLTTLALAMTLCTALRAAPVLRISADAEHNIYAPGQPVTIQVQLDAYDGPAEQGTLKFRMEDFFGRIIEDVSQPVDLIQGVLYMVHPDQPEPGHYSLRAMLIRGNGEKFKAEAAMAVVAPGVAPSEDSFFAVCGGDAWNLNALGASWSRFDISWPGVERVKGTFDFSRYDKRVDALLAGGVNVLGILDYSPDWAARVPEGYSAITEGPHKGWGHFPPKNLDEWGNYIYETVTHFRGRVTHWEVWNEPYPNTLFFNGGTVEDYVDILEVTWERGREACPECTFVGLGGTHFLLADKTFAAGGYPYMHAASIHIYQPGIPPESGHFIQSIQGILDVMDKYGERKPVWITETGWPTHRGMSEMWAGISVADQARYLARAMLIAKVHGVQRLFWYTIRNGGTDPGNFEQHQGLLYHDSTPKPSFVAYNVIAGLLHNAQPGEFRRLEDGGYAASFTTPENVIVAVWTTGKERFVPAKSNAEYMDMMGAPIAPDERGIRIFREPVYILFPADVSEDEISSMF